MGILKFKVVVLFLFVASSLYSQTSLERQTAFNKSLVLEQDKKYSEAINTLLSIYKADDYAINLRLGWLAYKDEKFIESENYYQRATGLMPYAVEPMLGMINAKSGLNKWDDVEGIYKAILKKMPTNTYVAYNLGLLYYNTGKFILALEQLKMVVNLYPTDYDSVLLYAWINLKMGKAREAKILFNNVLLLYPGDASASEGLQLLNK